MVECLNLFIKQFKRYCLSTLEFFVRPTGKTVKISPLTNQPNENNDFNYIPRSRPIIGWIQYRISFIPIDQRECITKFNRTVWY